MSHHDSVPDGETLTDESRFYPYRFRSIFKEKVWGGRNLQIHLGKYLPENKLIGESWELSDRDNDMSIVASGSRKGKSLRQLIEADRAGIMGPRVAPMFPRRFPLLVKYIDAMDILSVQVHPDDGYAMDHENGEWGKMEAWYIIHCEPGSFVYRATKPNTDRETFLRLLQEGRLHECLNKISVSPGDVIFVPPGCVHATGGGILFCEIQQNSDLTYRVYDWGRPGLDGKPRELHLEKALEVIDWGLPEREKAGRAVGARVPGPSGTPPAPSELLLECPKFAMQRIALKSGGVDAADATQCFHILCVIDGTGTIVCPRRDVPSTAIAKGGTYLIPSALQSYHLTTDGTLTAVRAYVP